jgi:hypothetical protein
MNISILVDFFMQLLGAAAVFTSSKLIFLNNAPAMENKSQTNSV